MQRNSTRKAVPRSPTGFSPSRDEIVGVANLLDQCIRHLTTRYGVSRSNLSGALVQGSAELPALLRVLQYAKVDAIQSLNDSGCADLLSQCISRLSHNQMLEDHATPQALSFH
jgi:hypothetical protein